MRFGLRTSFVAVLAVLASGTLVPAAPAAPADAAVSTWALAVASGPVHPLAGAKPDYGEADARFGASRSGHVHEGQDVFAPAGTPLVAVADGTVLEAGSDAGRGNYLAIFDPVRDMTYVYLHMLEPAAPGAGEDVTAGERIGAVGCTGSCWGDHLHFEVHLGRDPYGKTVDPLPLLEDWPQAGG